MKKRLPQTVLPLTVFLLLFSCQKPAQSNCLLEPDPGVCRAAIPKYYYDKEAKECKEFTWGGCGGLVPFDSMKECLDCGCDKR